MTQITDEATGNITCYQGDTIIIDITGVDTSYSYTAYCQIRNGCGKPIGEQVSKSTNNLPDVSFKIPHTTSDLMTVPIDQDFEVYTYGIKLVLSGDENTMFIGDEATFGTENTITVYRKKVDGV